jgi:hypothetical protein
MASGFGGFPCLELGGEGAPEHPPTGSAQSGNERHGTKGPESFHQFGMGVSPDSQQGVFAKFPRLSPKDTKMALKVNPLPQGVAVAAVFTACAGPKMWQCIYPAFTPLPHLGPKFDM